MRAIIEDDFHEVLFFRQKQSLELKNLTLLILILDTMRTRVPSASEYHELGVPSLISRKSILQGIGKLRSKLQDSLYREMKNVCGGLVQDFLLPILEILDIQDEPLKQIMDQIVDIDKVSRSKLRTILRQITDAKSSNFFTKKISDNNVHQKLKCSLQKGEELLKQVLLKLHRPFLAP